MVGYSSGRGSDDDGELVASLLLLRSIFPSFLVILLSKFPVRLALGQKR